MMQFDSRSDLFRLVRVGILCLGMAPVFGAQQSVQVTSGVASLTLPNTAPWTTIGLSTNPMRWEMRIHNFGSDWPSYPAHLIDLGPVELMRGQFTNWAQATTVQSPSNGDVVYNNGPLVTACCNAMSDVLVRVQRDVANDRYTLEICNASGGGCLSGTAQILSYGAQSWANWNMNVCAGGEVAFLRWFSGVVPIGTPIPVNGVVGNLGDWEFEGNLLDSSGHGLNFSGGAVSYSATPVYPPACNAGTQQTFRAGYPANAERLRLLCSGRRHVSLVRMAIGVRAAGAELVQPQRGATPDQRIGVWDLRVPIDGHGQQQPVERVHGEGRRGSDRRQ